MTTSQTDRRLRQAVQRVEPGSRLLRAWPVSGGSSAQVTALEVARPDGHTVRLIFRQYGEADLRANPHVAAAEFGLLQRLRAEGLPVPEPCAVDESGEILPGPYIVTEYVEGMPDFAPLSPVEAVRRMAACLARIHRVDAATLDPPLLPKPAPVRVLGRPSDADQLALRIWAALVPVWPRPSRNPAALLHGDFWPGNLLWREGQIAAVIDWEDAHMGDPVADLANARLEVLLALGPEAMEAFTYHYLSQAPIDATDLPYWDLYVALRAAPRLADWAADAVTERRWRERHRLFAARALEKLQA